MKKKVLFFTCADINNFDYAVMMLNSLSKFHPVSENVDIILFTNETNKTKLASLPTGIILEDLNRYTKDDLYFFYRQKPIIAENYIDNYEVVCGLDADQIILADLSYIWKREGYDVGVVVNWNRIDPQSYGFVEMMRIGIPPPEYYNCGLVAMRSKKFVHHWKILCFEKEFYQMQYKEQDILNILCHFGNYNVFSFDGIDSRMKTNSWYGIISKGEYARAEYWPTNKEIVIPKGFGDTPFPPTDIILRVIHAGGGNTPNKMNYRTWFADAEVLKRIDYLVGRTP